MSEGPKTRNKGEVSEFYALAYILGNVKLQLVDGNLNPKDQDVEFLRVERDDGCSYEILNQPNRLVVIRKRINGQQVDLGTVSCSSIKNAAEELFNAICHSSGKNPITLESSELVGLQSLLKTDRISAKSADKADFHAEVKSGNQVGEASLGFSIKSRAGARATLINANKDASALVFEVVRQKGKKAIPADDPVLTAYAEKNFPKIRDRINYLKEKGFSLKFADAKRPELRFNLSVIDSNFGKMLGALMLEFYQGEGSSMAELVHTCALHSDDMPCIKELGTSTGDIETALSYKVQQFLLAFATGATVSKKWDCLDKANGGMVIVKENGEVVCLELFTRNAISAYLLNNTTFDTPSRGRHHWGDLRYEDGHWYMDLQLQVRFIERKFD
jgi:hypothetical protein